MITRLLRNYRNLRPRATSLRAQLSERAKRFSMQVGYEVEMAALETVDRDGHANVRVYWRRKPVALRMVH